MANGYLHITVNDLVFDNDSGVVYWKGGGRALGEVVSCIDSDENVHYYLKTTNIKKAILIDAFVPVGVNDYMLYSDSANFINVQINEEDFSGDGGGAGISITFLLPEGKYYTVKYVEANGDIKIFDPSGDGSELAEGLPDFSEASEGDVLAIGSDGPEWTTPVTDEKKIYVHNIYSTITSTNLHIAITSNSKIDTVEKLNAFLDAAGCTYIAQSYCASGAFKDGSTYHNIVGVYKGSTTAKYNVVYNDGSQLQVHENQGGLVFNVVEMPL